MCVCYVCNSVLPSKRQCRGLRVGWGSSCPCHFHIRRAPLQACLTRYCSVPSYHVHVLVFYACRLWHLINNTISITVLSKQSGICDRQSSKNRKLICGEYVMLICGRLPQIREHTGNPAWKCGFSIWLYWCFWFLLLCEMFNVYWMWVCCTIQVLMIIITVIPSYHFKGHLQS